MTVGDSSIRAAQETERLHTTFNKLHSEGYTASGKGDVALESHKENVSNEPFSNVLEN